MEEYTLDDIAAEMGLQNRDQLLIDAQAILEVSKYYLVYCKECGHIDLVPNRNVPCQSCHKENMVSVIDEDTPLRFKIR